MSQTEVFLNDFAPHWPNFECHCVYFSQYIWGQTFHIWKSGKIMASPDKLSLEIVHSLSTWELQRHLVYLMEMKVLNFSHFIILFSTIPMDICIYTHLLTVCIPRMLSFVKLPQNVAFYCQAKTINCNKREHVINHKFVDIHFWKYLNVGNMFTSRRVATPYSDWMIDAFYIYSSE